MKEFLNLGNNSIIEEIGIEKEKPYDQNDIQVIFEYIDKEEKLMLPMFFKALIDDSPNNDMELYKNLLYNKYSIDNQTLNILLGQINLMKNIPIEILSKYYARFYTCPSIFYRDLNRNLGLR